jgi:HK97 family phage prohead protease
MGDSGMAVQHKFINLSEFKASNEGAGGWEGYLSKFGELDDGGDIVAAGAYTDTIDQFLTRGFNAESHDWTFSTMIGFPVAAKEDKVGLYVKSQYHSTPDAQLVRTKAQERMAAGKGVYMSIGYEPTAPPIFILPKDYADEIPQYSTPELAQQNLAKAASFPRVRVLPKVDLYEGSIVSVPMLRSAEVTAMKSKQTATGKAIKGMFADALADRTNSPWNLWEVFMSVVCAIEAQDEAAEALMLPYDYQGAVNEAVQEFAALLAATLIEEDMEEDAPGGDTDDGGMDEGMDMGGMGMMGRTAPNTNKHKSGGSVTSLHEASYLDWLGTALKRFEERVTARIEMRTKEGRVLSTANWQALADMCDQMDELSKRVRSMLSDAQPKPKDKSSDKFDINQVFNHMMVMGLQLQGVPIK